MTPEDPPQPPRPPIRRWTPPLKAAVLLAVTAGVITTAEACRRYELSEDELAQWLAAFKLRGVPGLRVTRKPAPQPFKERRRGRPRRPPSE
jgi:transposase-like protein